MQILTANTTTKTSTPENKHCIWLTSLTHFVYYLMCLELQLVLVIIIEHVLLPTLEHRHCHLIQNLKHVK